MNSHRPAEAYAPVTLEDAALSKDKIPAPAEWSELMGRTTPFAAYSDLRSQAEWGKMTAVFGMTSQNVQNLPSLRGKNLSFTTDQFKKDQPAELKEFMRYAVSHPDALFKTLPFWEWQSPEEDDTPPWQKLLRNIVTTPNILYGWLSTFTEIALKTGGAMLTQPFHFLWKGLQFAPEKDPRTHEKRGFWQRLLKTVPAFFTQPFQNIKTSLQGIRKNWRTFWDDNTTPRFKKILQGIALGAKTTAQVIGLGLAALPPIGWPLALAAWAGAQTLSYASNALSYVRYFIDGLTTLLVNLPGAFNNRADNLIICKTSAKIMGKNLLLLIPTAAILAAATLLPGGQILPAITPALTAKLIAILSSTAIGAQLTAGLIHYQFISANVKKAQQLASHSSDKKIMATTNKPNRRVEPEKEPLLAAPPSPKFTPAPVSNSHYAVYIGLHEHDDIHTKIRELRTEFLTRRVASKAPDVVATLIEEHPHEIITPRAIAFDSHHQHFRWNEHQDNAWTEYKRRDTQQQVSDIVAISDDLNPQHILSQAIADEAKRQAMQTTLRSGLKQLRTAGKRITATHLATVIDDAALAASLATHYQATARQTINNHYTHMQHEYPSDKFLELAIRQVEGFILLHGTQRVLTIASAWDSHYAEAILLYTAAKGYKCRNRSTYQIPPFSAAHLETFKDLLAKKPYLGHNAPSEVELEHKYDQPRPSDTTNL